MGSFKVSLTALMIIMRWEVGGGVHNRLKASGILTTPDWIMLCHTSLLPASSFCIKIWEWFFSVSRSECQGHGNIECDTKRTSYWLLSNRVPFSIWRKLVLAGAVRLESEMQVNPGQLSDYPACPTIPPVRLSDRTVRQDSAFLELAIWVGRD